MNILLTAIGKRVQLIKHLKKNFNVIGVDAGELAPAIYFVDKFYQIEKFYEEGYIKSLFEICKKEKVDLLIPLYELEFLLLSKYREKFNYIGTTLVLSNSKIIDICNDKFKTYDFLHKNINCPKIYRDIDIENIIKEQINDVYPLIIKPKNGMGSSGVFKISNIKELSFFKDYVKEPIIQQYIQGEEYTVDVLCDFEGQPIYVVPRKRLEVRSGEVSKSKVVNDEKIIKETLKVIQLLNNEKENGIGLMGPLTIQFFKTKKDEIYFLEINPRFGGGVPLSFKAGADYSKALKEMKLGKKLKYEDFFEEITMLRFDDAIFIE